MGRYVIRFSCGHEDTIELFGKRTDIDHKISCLEKNGLCPACCRESREMAMTDFERMHRFPVLTGSEKFFHTEMKAAVYIEMEQYGFSRMLRKMIGKQYKKEHP